MAGNLNCHRAWTESVIYNSLLTIGVVAIFSGLAWLLSSDALEKTSSLDPRSHDNLQRFVVRLTYAVAAVVVIHLEFGAQGYLVAVSGQRLPSSWYGWVVLLYAPALILVTAVLIPFARRRHARARGGGRAADQLWLRIAAAATTVVVIIQVVVLSLLGNLPRAMWAQPPPALVAFGSTGPLLLATIPVVALILALRCPGAMNRRPRPRDPARRREATTLFRPARGRLC